MKVSFISRSRASSPFSRASLARSCPSMNCDVSCAIVSRVLLFSSTNTCARRFTIRCASSGVSATNDN